MSWKICVKSFLKIPIRPQDHADCERDDDKSQYLSSWLDTVLWFPDSKQLRAIFYWFFEIRESIGISILIIPLKESFELHSMNCILYLIDNIYRNNIKKSISLKVNRYACYNFSLHFPLVIHTNYRIVIGFNF